jgi:CBS domain-containing protein
MKINFQVKDIMTRTVQWVPPDTSVETAARVMALHDVGLLPIGSKEDIVGVITDRDIVTRVTAEGLDPKHTPVSKVMTAQTFYCYEDQDVEDACFMMEENRVRRLIVFDRQRNLEGILSLDDVAARARKDKLSGHILAKVGRIA